MDLPVNRTPKPDAPLVSVIMNCYNGAKYLREAIESVLAQSYENWEIVFWDNQSTDESASIFKSYGDPRLRYLYASEHTVLYTARRLALAECRGDLIAFLDVDDLWFPEKLQVQVPLFANEAVGMSCANYLLTNERQGTSKLAYSAVPYGKVLNALLEEYFVHFSTFIVRRRALDVLSYTFDPRFTVIGDFDLLLRLSVDWEMASVQRPLTVYRWHDDNLGRKTGFLFSDELTTWHGEVGTDSPYRDEPGFRTLSRKIEYGSVVRELYAGRRRAAYRGLKKVSPRQRLKVMLGLLLPGSVVRKRLMR